MANRGRSEAFSVIGSLSFYPWRRSGAELTGSLFRPSCDSPESPRKTIPPLGAWYSPDWRPSCSRHRRLLPSNLLSDCRSGSAEVPVARCLAPTAAPTTTTQQGTPALAGDTAPPAYPQLLADGSIATASADGSTGR